MPESGLLFFSPENIDLFHTMLLCQDAPGGIIQVDFLLMGSLELFPAAFPMNGVHFVDDRLDGRMKTRANYLIFKGCGKTYSKTVDMMVKKDIMTGVKICKHASDESNHHQ